MFTLVAFSEGLGADDTEQLVLGVPDQTHRVHDDDIYIGKFNRIIAASASCVGIQTARLVSPSLRGKSSLYITPLVNDRGFYAAYTTRHGDWRQDSPIPLVTNEALNAHVSGRDFGSSQRIVIGVWLADGPITPVKGEIWTVYAQAAAVVAEQLKWINAEMDWTPDLPVGRYQIVGARCWMDMGGLFRFSFIGQAERPGAICCHDLSLQEDPQQRLGNLGIWGEFDSVTPPSLDVLTGDSAGTTGAYLRIDLLKIA